jgi:hypothetical protein
MGNLNAQETETHTKNECNALDSRVGRACLDVRIFGGGRISTAV